MSLPMELIEAIMVYLPVPVYLRLCCILRITPRVSSKDVDDVLHARLMKGRDHMAPYYTETIVSEPVHPPAADHHHDKRYDMSPSTAMTLMAVAVAGACNIM